MCNKCFQTESEEERGVGREMGEESKKDGIAAGGITLLKPSTTAMIWYSKHLSVKTRNIQYAPTEYVTTILCSDVKRLEIYRKEKS